jgi:hypothetical protein
VHKKKYTKNKKIQKIEGKCIHKICINKHIKNAKNCTPKIQKMHTEIVHVGRESGPGEKGLRALLRPVSNRIEFRVQSSLSTGN